MKVAVIPIVIGARGTVTKGWVKGQEDFEIRELFETMHTRAFFRSTWILRRELRVLVITEPPGKTPESFQENEMLKRLWNFQIQIDHVISVRRPDLVIVDKKKSKKNLPNSRLFRSGWPHSKENVLRAGYRVKLKEYWEKSWRIEETCCHSNSCEKPSANAGVKNHRKSKIIVEKFPPKIIKRWINKYINNVVYWPTTRPGCQNRKCTYVNNRCIRSRIDRMHLLFT